MSGVRPQPPHNHGHPNTRPQRRSNRQVHFHSVIVARFRNHTAFVSAVGGAVGVDCGRVRPRDTDG
jgi:hypothetical protein